MMRRNKIPFVPSPHHVVERMLSIVDPRSDELLIDLGSGDGRIIIAASRDYRCKSIGVEINDALLGYSRSKIFRMGLHNAQVIKADLYTFDFRNADVLTLYLLPNTLELLKPKIFQLKKGSRIISHDFKIPGMEPKETYIVNRDTFSRSHKLYYYEID